MTARHVAIVGGGYSGTLQAIDLLRQGMARVTLIERSGRPGRGAAYGTQHASHLLNVRAGRMSAFADRPHHFADWLRARGGGGDEFAERRVYGAYLEELLALASSDAGDRLRIVKAEAHNVVAGLDGEAVRLRGAGEILADAVVLALGNLAPATPAGIDPNILGASAYVADPWRTDITAGLSETDRILLVGTGLSAIDAILMLEDAGFKGSIFALSRRGLVPRTHGEPIAASSIPQSLPPPRCLDLLRAVRADARSVGWRIAVDRLRNSTSELWVGASLGERRRFLRHLRPWWDVHRHRIAPQIAARIARLQSQGRLRFAAGHIASLRAAGDIAELHWRPRGSGEQRRVLVRRAVNCTGPSGNIDNADEPLLANLLQAGRIRADACRIGLDVDPGCRVIERGGQTSPTLFAVGPLTRGAFWEMVAVPDLRRQVRALAGMLSV